MLGLGGGAAGAGRLIPLAGGLLLLPASHDGDATAGLFVLVLLMAATGKAPPSIVVTISVPIGDCIVDCVVVTPRTLVFDVVVLAVGVNAGDGNLLGTDVTVTLETGLFPVVGVAAHRTCAADGWICRNPVCCDVGFDVVIFN